MQKGELTMAEYIEREKVIGILNDNIRNSAIRSAVNGYPEECFDGWTDAVSEAITEVEGIPAADVRPERHSYYRILIANTFMGRLGKNRDPIFQDRVSYVCAECGRGTIVKDKFCSHCGAKMDGKDGKK